MDTGPKIKIKGIRDGLLITLSDSPWGEVRQALLDHLDAQAGFLQGARLTLDVGNQVLRAAEMGRLRNDISERGISLWAILSNSPTTEKNAQTLGLATRITQPRKDLVAPSVQTELQSGEQAILLHRTLRSGFSIKHEGHIVVIGDVNPGAEVVAGGNVVVWGRMRGTVHAGATGNESAVVCALDLSPIQLRIAGKIATTPKRRGKSQPELARIQDGQVVAEPWKLGRSNR